MLITRPRALFAALPLALVFSSFCLVTSRLYTFLHVMHGSALLAWLGFKSFCLVSLGLAVILSLSLAMILFKGGAHM